MAYHFPCIRVIWDRNRVWPMPPVRYHRNGGQRVAVFHEVHVGPEPGFPAGRKGLALAGAWLQHGIPSEADGMIILDADVAVDPQMVAAMIAACASDPESVWTAPAKIWPTTTGRGDWIWAHWENEDGESQDCDEVARWFSFCFTYLPRRLIEHCLKNNRLQSWTYPIVDASVCKAARRIGVKGKVVPDCFPVHLHY